MTDPARLEILRDAWRARWDDALRSWSRFTKLSEPRWCLTGADEEREGLRSSFAMIRLTDQAVVISLRQVADLGLDRFAVEILAHEAGHHVLVPANLRDLARLTARLRRLLRPRDDLAPLVGNLWADLVINDRLAREAGLDMAGVFRALRPEGGTDALGGLYLRTYERLWGLDAGDLGGGAPVLPPADGRRDVEVDSSLAMRLVRLYSRDWLAGATRFALLVFPYLPERLDPTSAGDGWRDAVAAPGADAVPDGLTELDDDELEEPLHPAEDPALNGIGARTGDLEPARGASEVPAEGTGRKNPWRPPAEYVELMKSLNVRLSEDDLLAAWYRERSLPYGIRYPRPRVRRTDEPQPEGLDVWEPGDPVVAIDWPGTLARSPVWIPGVTTLQRTYGFVEGPESAERPPDLYLGMDCSGSMMHPARGVSWPVLASVVVARAALRAGVRVRAVLSGEPGRWTSTEGFVRDERAILRILTGYLGTGTTFGIDRLRDAFASHAGRRRPTHVLVASDSDFLFQLRERRDAAEIARTAAAAAGAGATVALQGVHAGHWSRELATLRDAGWTVAHVSDEEDLLRFGREFARSVYEGARAAEAAR